MNAEQLRRQAIKNANKIKIQERQDYQAKVDTNVKHIVLVV